MAKRKRESADLPELRAAPGMGTDFDHSHLYDESGMDQTETDMSFAAALASHNADDGDMNEARHDQMPSRQDDSHESAGHSASDTAAAAMAQYHTMTVPQSTEQAFMTQSTETPGDRPDSASADPNAPAAAHRASSFDGFDIGGLPKDGQANANGDGSPTGQASQGGAGPKPQVGTEEWHKVRRDNHKEGTSWCSFFPRLAANALQLSAGVVRRSTRASTSSQRLCLAVRRTRAAF